MREDTSIVTVAEGVDLHCYKWVPDNLDNIKGVFHLVHGSLEHAYRYLHVAERLTNNGFIVYAADHRGHGRTVKNQDPFFYFSDSNNGWDQVVDDINIINNKIREENEGLKISIFGHSMGSFLVRDFMVRYGDSVDAVILSGSGIGVPALQKPVEIYAQLLIALKGKKYRSSTLHHLVYGTLDRMVKGHKVKGDFISRDMNEVDKYQNDPFCNKTCTTDYAYQMLSNVTRINKKQSYGLNKSYLPLYIMSGEEDPVGGKGKGIKLMAQYYAESGFNDITIKIYPEARHELVNELNKDEVIDDMISWLNIKIQTIVTA